MNRILSLALNGQFAITCEKVQSTIRAWRVAFAVVHVGVAHRSACLVQRYEKRVRALARLVNGVSRFLVQEQDRAVSDVDVDVANGGAQGCICTGGGVDDCVGPPVTPDNGASAREDA